jgi:hypothetical protein
MWNPFKREKPNIYAQFISDMVRQGVQENYAQIMKNLRDSGVDIDEFELLVFSMFLPYNAMILAGMPDRIKVDYVTGAASVVLKRFPGSRDLIEMRLEQYSEAAELDMYSHLEEPVHPSQRTLIGAAVQNVIGVSNGRSSMTRFLFANLLASTYSATLPFLTKVKPMLESQGMDS